MRWFILGMGALALASCSKGPENSVGEPDIATNALAGVAFDYRYFLTLPSRRISDLQEQHALACETLAGRCRITGLTYRVGSDGDVRASLSVSVAAPIARAFGRDGVKAAEAVGATLTGANITALDVANDAAATATARNDVDAERTRIIGELARTDLKSAERAELLRQQQRATEQARELRDRATTQQDSLTNTPMTFEYQSGRGIGLVSRIGDAGDTAIGSVAMTITAVLWILAALGPPLLVIVIVYLLWRRWGRGWWTTLIARTDRPQDM